MSVLRVMVNSSSTSSEVTVLIIAGTFERGLRKRGYVISIWVICTVGMKVEE